MKAQHLNDKCNVWKEGNFEDSCYVIVQNVQRYIKDRFPIFIENNLRTQASKAKVKSARTGVYQESRKITFLLTNYQQFNFSFNVVCFVLVSYLKTGSKQLNK